MAVNLTPLEEYNKALVQQRRDLEKQTQSLRTPFKQLVSTVADTNAEFAKIASDSIGGTQDTWKGLITQGKKERLIREAHTEEYKAHNKAIKESNAEERQIILENQKNVIRQNEKILGQKENVAQKESALEETKANQKDRLDKIQIDRTTIKERILKETNTKAQDHFKRQLDTLDAQEGQLNKISDKRAQELTEAEDQQTKQELLSEKLITADEKRLTAEIEGRRQSEILVEETNEELEHQLDKASKTEGFDKFTGSIKTLTGGLVDIEGVLDPIAKQMGALKDLGSVFGITGENMKKPFKEFSSFLNGSREDGLEQAEELADKHDKLTTMVAVSTKKGKMGFGRLIKNVGLTGIALLALVAGIIALMNRFESFDKFIKGMFGWNDVEDQTKTDFDNTAAQINAGVITGDEKEEFIEEGGVGDQLIDQQGERVADLEYKEDVLDKGSEVAAVTTGVIRASANAITPTVSTGTAVRNAIDLAGDATRLNAAGQRINDVGRYVKPATIVDKTVATAKTVATQGSRNVVGTVLKQSASKIAAPVTVLMTGLEVNNALAESKDMKVKLEELNDAGLLTPEKYQEGLIAIEKKSSLMGEDVLKPISSSTAALAASAAAADFAAPMRT